MCIRFLIEIWKQKISKKFQKNLKIFNFLTETSKYDENCFWKDYLANKIFFETKQEKTTQNSEK